MWILIGNAWSEIIVAVGVGLGLGEVEVKVKAYRACSPRAPASWLFAGGLSRFCRVLKNELPQSPAGLRLRTACCLLLAYS